LDPFASGLLIVLIGEATKLSRWFLRLDKRYTATFCFGAETDTLDTEGSITAEASPPDRETVERALEQFRGAVEQLPPVHSALKVGGRRSYELARKGERPELAVRTVYVHRLELIDWGSEPNVFGTFDVACSSGTYIRSLARDLALASDTRAHCCALTRMSVGGFSLNEAVTDDAVPQLATSSAALLSIRAALERFGIPRLQTPDAGTDSRIQNGYPVSALLDLSAFDPGTQVLLQSSDGVRALALVENSGEGWRYLCVFGAGSCAE
jgi:tRNA pseudouridine55 synthase